jgi:hypothetical protein
MNVKKIIGKYTLCRHSHSDCQHYLPVLEFKYNLLEARNRLGIGLSYRLARLHRLADSNPWNQYLGSSLKVKKFRFCSLLILQYIHD